jgi:hypothetical protein
MTGWFLPSRGYWKLEQDPWIGISSRGSWSSKVERQALFGVGSGLSMLGLRGQDASMAKSIEASKPIILGALHPPPTTTTTSNIIIIHLIGWFYFF